MATDAVASTRIGRFPASLALAPGVALLLAIGFLGKAAERGLLAWGQAHHRAVPDIEYVLWAILIGFVVGNVVGVPRPFRAGVATYGFWLRLGIVLLGVRFALGDVLRLGALSLGATAVELALSIATMTWLGRRFQLKPKLVSLLAIGSSICGVSAIAAAKGAIEADDEDASYAIAVVLAVGAVSLFAFPLIGHWIGLSEHAYGLWAGLAIDNTAEATAAGALWSEEAGRVAVLAKTTRNATIGFVVLGYALYWAARGQAPSVETKAAFLWAKFPKFVLGFLAVSLLATFGALTPAQTNDIAALSHWSFLLTFAGVGLMTDLRGLLRQGVLPLLVGVVGGTVVAAATLAIVLALGPWLP